MRVQDVDESGPRTPAEGDVSTSDDTKSRQAVPEAWRHKRFRILVIARETFKAKVIGADPAAGLALLQLEGPKGRSFSTVTVGNSATLVKSAEAARESS
jgi:hypothetical protein